MENAGALHLERRAAACAEIVMGYHVLEKGLTMPRRRLGFGKGAVVHLANLVDAFERRFGRGDAQVEHAVGVLRAYRELHRDWPEPMPRLDAFLSAHAETRAAVEPHVTRSEFFAAKDAPFPEFAASRHVVRHFAGAVPRETIEAAVSLALTAPSACNRQHARVHAVDDPELRDRLFELQGGTRGFGADADKVLVVTSLGASRRAEDAALCVGREAVVAERQHVDEVVRAPAEVHDVAGRNADVRVLSKLPEPPEPVERVACAMPTDVVALRRDLHRPELSEVDSAARQLHRACEVGLHVQGHCQLASILERLDERERKRLASAE